MNATIPNRTLYIHDNLDILRGMNSESIDLIATDPPFNTKGGTFTPRPIALRRARASKTAGVGKPMSIPIGLTASRTTSQRSMN